MPLTAHDLYKTFYDRAFWTNHVIEAGLSSRLGVLEETITDINLLEIDRLHQDYVLTKKFSRKEEGVRSGADWLWCMGEPGAWLSILVQAKITNPRTSLCHNLNYGCGQQRQLLTKFAKANKFLPVYCIYGSIPKDFTPLTKSLQPLSDFDPKEWSCALIIPKHIKKLNKHKRRKQSEILGYAMPWTYPLRYAFFHKHNQLAFGLAEAFSNIIPAIEQMNGLSSVNVLDASKQSERRSTSKARMYSDNPNPLTLITQDLPKIVYNLFSGRIRATLSPISGVSIVSTVPVHSLFQNSNALPAPTKDPLLTSLDALNPDGHLYSPQQFQQPI